MTPAMIVTLRGLPYVDQWVTARGKGWFHLQFEDLSIISFQSDPAPSYQFLDCPLDVPTLAEFLDSQGRNFRDRHSADVQDEYEMCIDTANVKENVTPIRYDWDRNSYRSGVHPVAHLHIGLDNEIRIGLKREMTPLAFLLFVIRQRYPLNWELLLNSVLEKQLENLIRGSLPPIHADHYRQWDENELYLV